MKEFSVSQWHQELVIGMLSRTLDGMEKMRIQTGNRAAQATRAVEDKDGVMRGFGLEPSSPVVSALLSTREGLRSLEESVSRELERAMKAHPLAPWIESKRGLGYKSVARLIGEIGDPYLRTEVLPDGTITRTPRSPRFLYAYCGLHVVEEGTIAPYRQRGVRSNWSDGGRKRLYLMAVSQRYDKQAHWRPVYDEAKLKAQATCHVRVCVRCGPSGKPAQPGSLLGGGHAEGRALRKTAKTILKEMWRESRRLHGMGDEEDGFVDKWKEEEEEVTRHRQATCDSYKSDPVP